MRCEECEHIRHKTRGGLYQVKPHRPKRLLSSKVSRKKKTAGSTTITEHAKDLSPSFSEHGSDLGTHEWSSSAINTEGTPEQSKDHTKPETETVKSDTRDDSTFLIKLLDQWEFFKQCDDEQPSSEDPTPASEAWEYWEDSPEFNSDSVDGETLLELLQGPLDFVFHKWLGDVCCDDGGEGNGAPSSSSSASHSDGSRQPDSKRKRVDNTQTEAPENRPNKLRMLGKRSRKLTPLHKLLACPYFKRDSRRHRTCCGFGFTKISYMKGHLYRNHAIPIYCPVCQQSFENVQLRDNHSRERDCEPIENVQDGITSEQRDWLHQRGPRNFSEEQHWFRIFEFLFPDHPLPYSAYNDTTFSEDLLNFRDFISEPAAQDLLLQRVRENPQWTPELEAIFRPDLVHGLDQLYWRWAATERRESDPVSAIESPSQEPETLSAQSTNEEETPPSPQPESGLGESNDSSRPEIATRGASGAATSEFTHDLHGEEPRLDSVEALVFADRDLEELKVDEADQPPPRQLNHEGIHFVPEQNQWPPAGFSEMDHTYYNPVALTNDIEYGLSATDDVFFNSLDDIEGAEGWRYNFDVLDYEASLPFGDPDDSPADESPVDVGLTETDEERDIKEGDNTDAGKSSSN